MIATNEPLNRNKVNAMLLNKGSTFDSFTGRALMAMFGFSFSQSFIKVLFK